MCPKSTRSSAPARESACLRASSLTDSGTGGWAAATSAAALSVHFLALRFVVNPLLAFGAGADTRPLVAPP